MLTFLIKNLIFQFLLYFFLIKITRHICLYWSYHSNFHHIQATFCGAQSADFLSYHPWKSIRPKSHQIRHPGRCFYTCSSTSWAPSVFHPCLTSWMKTAGRSSNLYVLYFLGCLWSDDGPRRRWPPHPGRVPWWYQAFACPNFQFQAQY